MMIFHLAVTGWRLESTFGGVSYFRKNLLLLLLLLTVKIRWLSANVEVVVHGFTVVVDGFRPVEKNLGAPGGRPSAPGSGSTGPPGVISDHPSGRIPSK